MAADYGWEVDDIEDGTDANDASGDDGWAVLSEEPSSSVESESASKVSL